MEKAKDLFYDIFGWVVKIEYIYHSTNIHSIQENADIFKVIVSIYNQFLFNVVFRQVL